MKFIAGLLLSLIIFTGAAGGDKVARGTFIGKWQIMKVVKKGVTTPLSENEQGYYEFRADGTVGLSVNTGDNKNKWRKEGRWFIKDDISLVLVVKNGIIEEKIHVGISGDKKVLTLSYQDLVLIMEKIGPSFITVLPDNFLAERKKMFIGNWTLVKYIDGTADDSPSGSRRIVFRFNSDGTLHIITTNKGKEQRESSSWALTDNGILVVTEKAGTKEELNYSFLQDKKTLRISTVGLPRNVVLEFVKEAE